MHKRILQLRNRIKELNAEHEAIMALSLDEERDLTTEEQAQFEHSASAVQGLVDTLVSMGALRDPAED